MIFFEQELRKLFEKNDILSDIRFLNRFCTEGLILLKT
jgi:hypothetical protein